MRTSITLLILLLLNVRAQATTLFDQLRAFNPYWQGHAGSLQGLPVRVLDNDVHYVQAHLEHVLAVLADADISHLSGPQRELRKELIGLLGDYARQGVFPINYHRHERTPVFIDEHDTFCAVGFLMRSSGEEVMARRIAATDNFAWVRQVTDPELGAWQERSGFTLEELKLIQGAYDFYQPRAWLLPDKYEVPQKPEQVVRYFEGKDSRKVWCKGEGSNGDLHGSWVQNYSATLPWIEGFFEHGERSGRWKEYYKGTDKLCRTEHWRNDKLNGVRTRYDREGRVIENILFKNGVAVVKTNIDEHRGLRWVRTPVDSATVHTEIFTTEGGLVAAGNERIHNPEGLQWFQNIELTALNSFAISARDGAPRPEFGVLSNGFNFDQDKQQLPGLHTLVQYRKEGDWVYYKDYLREPLPAGTEPTRQLVFALDHTHFGAELFANLASYDHLEITASYDSMHVAYADDRMVDFRGFKADEQDRLQFTYHAVPGLYLVGHRLQRAEDHPLFRRVKCISRLDRNGDLIGTRVEYDAHGLLLRTEQFHQPYRGEDEVFGILD
ncbi:MAG TPA: hypothetical protein VGE21_06655 [Flavobacteriales bacterium]